MLTTMPFPSEYPITLGAAVLVAASDRTLAGVATDANGWNELKPEIAPDVPLKIPRPSRITVIRSVLWVTGAPGRAPSASVLAGAVGVSARGLAPARMVTLRSSDPIPSDRTRPPACT